MKTFIQMCLVLFGSTLFGQNWSLQDPAQGWNTNELVRMYYHNSELQTQWAFEALSHYTFKGNEQVLDFGSGDGKVSALISFLVPKGSVLGIDLSNEMVDFASKIFPQRNCKNLSFLKLTKADCSDFVLSRQFDLVTSFCVFHLVPYPSKILQNLKSNFHPKSKLVATFPIGGNLQFFKAAVDVMKKRGLSFPTATEETNAMRDPVRARELFEKVGFKFDYFKVVESRFPFSTKEELTDWFEGTLSANWSIPKERRREFFVELTDRYLEYMPEDNGADGCVYFTLKRIDLVASLKR